MQLSIFQKGLILATFPLCLQIAFLVAFYCFQTDYAEADRWASHTKEVIARAQEINSTISDADAAVRGYIISLNPTFADPFRVAQKEIPSLLDELKKSVSDNPDQSARAISVRSATNSVLIWLADLETLVRDGNADAAVAQVRTSRGDRLLNDFRGSIRAFLNAEGQLDQSRTAEVQHARSRLNTLCIIGAGATAIGMLLLSIAFRSGIAQRFSILERNIHSIGTGKMPLAPLVGSDEFARLDHTFRDMAKQLTQANESIRDLYNYAPCGYHSVDPDGMVVAMNETELKWLGYTAEEILGRMRFADLVTPQGVDLYRAGFERVKEDGFASDIELVLRRKDGTDFPVLINSSAVLDENGKYLRSRTTLFDLTERKKAEAAVRLFADVAHNIPIGLLIYQLDGNTDDSILRVRSGNLSASLLLGLSLDHSIGSAVSEVFPSIPDDQLKRYRHVATSGHADDLGEFRYGDARVEERWWAVLAFPLPDRSVGVAFQDITKRKWAEAEILRLNNDLENRVKARTLELEATNRDLANKNAENEMFVYSVSHDLRSPLVNLQGFSRELEKSCQRLVELLGAENVPPDVREIGLGLLDGKMAKSLGFIQKAVLRLSAIIDAILRLSRTGRIEYRWETIDMKQLVERVVAASQITVAEKGATIRIGDLPNCWGDRTAVEQVFGNLIQNALGYLDRNRSGLVEVGSLTQEASSGIQTFFVRDNGLGIAEGHRQKIFQPFQRAHPGIGTGEGLGLAIVARITERHRGHAWVESQVGIGSTFFITLPVVPDGR